MSVCFLGKRRYMSPQSGYPRANQDLSVCFQIGVPIANQDYVCLLWGEAEVRVALYPLGTQNKRLYNCLFWESEGTSCFNDDRVIGLRNLVTERVVIGQYDLIVERERYHSRNLVTECATDPQSKFVKHTHGQRMKGLRNVSFRHLTIPASESLLSYETRQATPTSDLLCAH